MYISRRVEYAIRTLMYLAREAQGTPMSRSAIAASEGIPEKFLEKILIQLKRAGLVESRKGAQGGYLLSQKPEAITFKQVLDVVEADRSLNACSGADAQGCSEAAFCTVFPVWRRLQRNLDRLLEAETIASALNKTS
jgi:Rrf2 family protein